MAKKKKQEAARENERVQQERPKAPKQGSPLLTILTVLLVLVGVAELGLWGYCGLGAIQNSRARQRYEAEQQEALASNGTVSSSSYGPVMRVDNGSVTWQRELDPRIVTTQSGGSSTGLTLSGGAKRLSPLSVANIPYALAESETSAAPQGAEPLTDGGSTAA